MEELEVKVSGRVQGVGFRYTIKKFADLSGLKGYIENKNDGSVEILVQGREARFYLDGQERFTTELHLKPKTVDFSILAVSYYPNSPNLSAISPASAVV